MPLSKLALDFLDRLERSEQTLLTWGLVDGFFAEEEITERARSFLEERRSQEIETSFFSEFDLVEALCDEGLLLRLPASAFSFDTIRYRTRFAESVRLLASLRQIFDDPQRRAWRTAPRLVADFRLLRSARAFPRRHVSPPGLIERLREGPSLSPVQVDVANALLGTDTTGELLLADFQVNAAARILTAVKTRRSSGTVVSAGTGSGKTLAFYLPAYVRIAETLDASAWTRCLAIYPRKELLKDQLREAIANARRMAPALRSHRRRLLVIGALYGDVPQDGAKIAEKWTQLTFRGQLAYRCPYLQCPVCGGALVWSADDAANNLERLLCANRQCEGRIDSDEIRLTRSSMFASPPDVLFTTTEMLNQRLSSSKYERLFGIGLPPAQHPAFVLIDEIHAQERTHGAHVAYLLRRWRHRSHARPHFVGLSATLADAPRFFSDLVGIGPGDVTEVTPATDELQYEGAEYQLALRGNPTAGASLLSTSIQAAMLLRRIVAPSANDPHFGSRVFAFTDNLDAVNRLYHDLLDAEGRDALGRPSSRPLGSLANLRSRTAPNAAERFHAGQNWALLEDLGHPIADGERARVGRTSSQDPGVSTDADIVVATSSLEVGFDDPEVGAVLQHKAPQSAAAFLQRRGRAGRRRSQRPWTIVVLSDWGRDRRAYQSYERMFSPVIEPSHLPLDNPAILRIQATYALFDWLAAKLPSRERADPWLDLSAPARSPATERRQVLYAHWLSRVLEDVGVREDFATYLERALGISPETVMAVMWRPPRSILLAVVPTLLRRLESRFQLAGRNGVDLFTNRAPLPDFVPRALFGDFQLPEVALRLPAYRGRDARDELMPLTQALAEFAPGRVSRRFGVTDATERHWVHPGSDTSHSLRLAEFCPTADRRDLGHFSFVENGQGLRIKVFRPHALHVKVPPANIGPSSNAILDWRTQIVPSGDGYILDVPTGSAWAALLSGLSFHTHNLGLPVEMRRFAVAARTTIVRQGGHRVERRIEFHEQQSDGSEERAALGFAADVDAMEVRISYPGLLHRLCARDARLVRGLRTARFRALIFDALALDGVANAFQREWLAQVYLTAVTIHALNTASELGDAEAAVFAGSSVISPLDVAATILNWGDDGGGNGHAGAAGGTSRRLQELQDLLRRVDVIGVLHDAAIALTEIPDSRWEHWLRKRFKATLGAALAQAAHDVCPQADAETLLVEVEYFSQPQSDDQSLDDAFWMTEEVGGGGGVIEALLPAYAEDPRRFFQLVEGALGPSDLEAVADDLARVLADTALGEPHSSALRSVFMTLRAADSHAAKVDALAKLRVSLSKRAVHPTPALLIALNARLLGPGTSERTDSFAARLLSAWHDAERHMGIEIDARAFALVHSRDSALEAALGVIPEGRTEEARISWRYGVLYGMLWSRGSELRSHTLRARNPFARLLECDRLLVLAAVPPRRRSVDLSEPSWFEVISDILIQDGVAELSTSIGDPRDFADALRRIAAEPIDTGGVLAYTRLTAIHREDVAWRGILELPEAFQ